MTREKQGRKDLKVGGREGEKRELESAEMLWIVALGNDWYRVWMK